MADEEQCLLKQKKHRKKSFQNTEIFCRKNPFEKANVISKLFFIFVLPFVKLGAKKNLTLDEIWSIREVDKAENLGNYLETNWKKELRDSRKAGRPPTLLKPLIAVFWKKYLLIGFFLILSDCVLQVIIPLLLQWFIASFGDSTVTRSDQYISAAGLCSALFATNVISHYVAFSQSVLCMQCSVAITTLIYRKLLRLQFVGPVQPKLGHIVNLIASDADQLKSAILSTPMIIIGPFQFIFLAYILIRDIGYPGVAGLAVLLLLTPLQFFVEKYSGRFQLASSEFTDERTDFMIEIINGIRLIKMHAWEKSVSEMIHHLRLLEVNSLKKYAYLTGFFGGLYTVSMHPMILSTIVTYILMGNEIAADKVFYATSIYGMLVIVFCQYLPQGIMGLASGAVALRRLKKFLIFTERKKYTKLQITNTNNSKPLVSLTDVSVSWTSDNLTLNKLNLRLEGDQLVMIIGTVGAGKSSFLKTLIGELTILSGNTHIRGKISYASQEAWIFSGTIRQNILFDFAYDEIRYKKVVSVCCLETDFEMFEFGDSTLVGERGVTLSGGQKARINLARAIYQKAEIYLLDDPLSSVDAGVSKQIFYECIKTFLGGHLRILVTHQHQYLPEADHTIILEDGKVLAQGTYTELQSRNLDIMTNFQGNLEEDNEIELGSDIISPAAEKDDEGGEGEQDSQDELVTYGKVTSRTYLNYVKSRNSVCTTITILVGFIVAQFFQSGSYWWLSYWTNYEQIKQTQIANYARNNTLRETLLSDPKYAQKHLEYLWIYVGFVAGVVFGVIILALCFYNYTMRISVNIHNKMFKSVISAPTRFFDKNPPGRILNRFTGDLGRIDGALPGNIYEALSITLQTVGTFVIVISTNYYLIFPTCCALCLLYCARWYYVQTIRDVQRLEAVSQSPIFTNITSTHGGIATIRSSNSEQFVKEQFENFLNKHTATDFVHSAATAWFALWVELAITAYFAVITFGFLFSTNSTLPGSVGMALVSIMELSLNLQWGMCQSSELESSMTSLERIEEYVNIQPEISSHPGHAEPEYEVKHGEIRFDSVSLVYDEKPVLKNLSFTVKSQEKIGIVGRTGAGKSSIINALFRMAEPTGSIYIDNILITNVNLHDLRKSISIIPQQPQLFSKTMRYNLDPCNEFQDSDLWASLEQLGLTSIVKSLDMVIANGGTNFSAGERQLVCLARAILRNNKILILDEATANIDPKTDDFIRAIIRTKFADNTVITIAHMLQNVMDSDRILVLDEGILQEFDHPYTLLQNENGYLKSLVNQTSKSTQ